MLYARSVLLRNCGRFTVVASDFGSDYRTHTHVSSEALYASLTRGATRRPRVIDLKHDEMSFTDAYDVDALRLWCTPGLFFANGSYSLAEEHLDTVAFNVLNELDCSTSADYELKKGVLKKIGRRAHIPSYGTIQTVKPDRRMRAYLFSEDERVLTPFITGQTFLLGKKRTMFQIVELSPVLKGVPKDGGCATWWLELPSQYGGRFVSMEIAAATLRYLILRGTTRGGGGYIEFAFAEEKLCLPDFYLQSLPVAFQGKG